MLRADSLNYTQYLHFYHSNNKTVSNGTKVPLVQILDDDEILLTYDNYSSTINVSRTLNSGTGLLNFSLSDELVGSVVTLTWEQHTLKPVALDCDVWSLDNVVVTLHYGDCERNLLDEDFEEDQQYVCL